MAKSAYDLTKDALGILNSKLDGVSTSTRVFFSGLVIVHVACHVFESLSRDGTAEDRAKLKADMIRAYHDFVAPLDIPGIPNYIEPLLDNAIETGIGATADALMEKVLEVHAAIDVLLKAK